ncbi:unnamed protein product, partial [Ectocarpus fasciculatus]
QLAPVVVNGAEADTCAASVLSSSYYRARVKVFRLTKTMRNREDPPFSKMVDDIGDGVSPVDEEGFTTISGVQTEQDLEKSIDFVFPLEVLKDPIACAKRAVISLHKDTVDDINDRVLTRIPDVCHTLEGRTLLDHEHLEGDTDDVFCMSDYLSLLQPPGIPAHTIRLKKGVVVMLCRNLSIDDKLTNGSKVLVMDINAYTLQVKTLDDGTIHWLPRITFKFVTWQGVAVKRVQFPVRLCFAVTVHRAQGQTLDRVCFDLSRHPFAHGHVYVGLSRVRKSADMIIFTTPDRIDDNGFARVHNVVFMSLL